MKKSIIKLLLWLLNTIDNTPCKYGYIDNIHAFDREFLDFSKKEDPHMLLRDFLRQMDLMDACMKRGGNCVVQGNTVRPMTDEDTKDLQNLTP